MNIYELALTLGTPARIGLLFVGLVEAGLAIYSWSKRRTVEGVLLTLAAVFTLLFNVVLYANDSITTIPDFVDGTYIDAQHRAESLGVSVEAVRGRGKYVKSQSVSPGEPCRKGTTIQLELEEYRSSPKAIASFENEVDADYVSIVAQLSTTEIKFYDDDLTQTGCLGPELTEVRIEDAYLACKEYGIRYVNYEYENGIITFSNVANTVEYVMVIKAEGYKETELYIDPAVLDMTPASFGVPYNLHLEEENRDFEIGSTIFFVDENKEFLPWFEFFVQWSSVGEFDGDPVWYGYNANERGRFPSLIYVFDDYNIRISYAGNDIICDLVLKKNGDSYYLMINEDGTITVLDSFEFWGISQ